MHSWTPCPVSRNGRWRGSGSERVASIHPASGILGATALDQSPRFRHPSPSRTGVTASHDEMGRDSGRRENHRRLMTEIVRLGPLMRQVVPRTRQLMVPIGKPAPPDHSLGRVVSTIGSLANRL